MNWFLKSPKLLLSPLNSPLALEIDGSHVVDKYSSNCSIILAPFCYTKHQIQTIHSWNKAATVKRACLRTDELLKLCYYSWILFQILLKYWVQWVVFHVDTLQETNVLILDAGISLYLQIWTVLQLYFIINSGIYNTESSHKLFAESYFTRATYVIVYLKL